MTVRCEVCGQLPLQGSPRSFFPWPTDSSQRTYWQTCLGLQVVDLNKSDLFICSDHFDSMQMIRKGTALRKDAFPKRYMGPLPIFAPEDESPKIETLLDTTAVKNEDGIFGGAGPSAPIFDDEEIMPEELSMAKLVQMFAAAAKERPPTIVPLVTPIAEETKAFSNILIDRQEKYLNSYCKSCLRQAELVNMLEANCEGVPVSLMYKTVFMSEINGTEVPQMMCATCIGLLFQCFKFSTMTVRSCEVLQAARERFKYLPAIDDGTIDLKNIPQKYSAKSSAIQPVIQSDGEDTKEDITVAKKRKSVVKAKEVPEKKGRRTSSRKASEKAKKVSKKILEESEDEESNDIFDNDDADPDFDTAAYEVKDESPEVSEAEEDNKEGDNTEEDPEDNYCMLCRHSFSNMVRHMDKVHRVDWESKSCERCQKTFETPEKLVDHCKSEDHFIPKCHKCNLEYEDESSYVEHVCTTENTIINSKQRKRRTKVKSTDFCCNKCGEFNTPKFKEIFEHFQNEHPNETSCLLCRIAFKTRESILNHMEVHSKKTFCRTHFLAFDTPEELEQHLKIPDHNRTCIKCDNLLLKSKKDYLAHRLKKHLGKDRVKCPHCPLYYENRQNVRRHIMRFHEKLKFMCEQCGNTYTTRTNLRLHVARQHENREPEKFEPVCCEECGKMFRNQKTLFNHRFKKHWGHSCICRHCKQTFPDEKKLQEHVKETGHELFECEICHKTYVTKVKYMQHVETHTETDSMTKYRNVGVRRRWWKYRVEGKLPTVEKGDPNRGYICTICKREFKNMQNMIQHKKIHFSDKPFKCEICGKSFRIKRFLTCHINIHTGNRPFKCQYCDKRFMNDSSKYQHEMIHTGKRPHRCPACDKGFISSSAMKKHIQIHMKDSKSVAYLSEYLKNMRPKVERFSSEQEALEAAGSEEHCSNQENNTIVDNPVDTTAKLKLDNNDIVNKESSIYYN